MSAEDSLIIAGNDVEYLIKKGGNTSDIIKAIEIGDSISVGYVEDFAHTLQGEDVADTCFNIFTWVRENIPYVEDKKGVQLIQLPGQVYNNRYAHLGGTGKGADCKSMSLFCSSVLRALGNYDFSYRFISETPGANVHHVYLIVDYIDANGNKVYIPLDCTLDQFGVEVDFKKKIDKSPTVPIEIGIGATTQAQEEQSFWEITEAYFRDSPQAAADEIFGRVIDGVKAHYSGQAVRRNKAVKLIEDNWPDLLATASTAIYHYWNDKSLISYFACQLNPNNQQDIPFPSQYAEKMDTSHAIVDAFEKIGMRDADIMSLVSLGTYAKYGVTLEYMLYKCYCIELYGQPFKPRPGVPYYNNKQGKFIANGASLNDVLAIALCCPAQGGIGRPYSEPYWSLGGNILLNGYQRDINTWLTVNPRPGTPIEGDTNNRVGGVIVNNGAGISADAQQQALTIYNRWAKGNMVVLPQNPATISNRPGVGAYGVAETITIVVAVISAVVTITTLIAKLVELFKHPDSADKIALPTQDFQWLYQTGDGCIIGQCVNLNGCNGAQTAKMCNGEIVEVNPDLNNPNNQQPDPGNFFGVSKLSKKQLLMGAGALILGGVGVMTLNED